MLHIWHNYKQKHSGTFLTQNNGPFCITFYGTV